MFITSTTVIAFYSIGLLSVALGHWLKRLEIYSFGVLLIFVFSGFIWFSGISEPTGEVIVTSGNNTVVTTQYDKNTDGWTNILSVGGMLLAVTLALTTYREYVKEEQRKQQEEIE